MADPLLVRLINESTPEARDIIRNELLELLELIEQVDVFGHDCPYCPPTPEVRK